MGATVVGEHGRERSRLAFRHFGWNGFLPRVRSMPYQKMSTSLLVDRRPGGVLARSAGPASRSARRRRDDRAPRGSTTSRAGRNASCFGERPDTSSSQPAGRHLEMGDEPLAIDAVHRQADAACGVRCAGHHASRSSSRCALACTSGFYLELGMLSPMTPHDSRPLTSIAPDRATRLPRWPWRSPGRGVRRSARAGDRAAQRRPAEAGVAAATAAGARAGLSGGHMADDLDRPRKRGHERAALRHGQRSRASRAATRLDIRVEGQSEAGESFSESGTAQWDADEEDPDDHRTAGHRRRDAIDRRLVVADWDPRRERPRQGRDGNAEGAPALLDPFGRVVHGAPRRSR